MEIGDHVSTQMAPYAGADWRLVGRDGGMYQLYSSMIDQDLELGEDGMAAYGFVTGYHPYPVSSNIVPSSSGDYQRVEPIIAVYNAPIPHDWSYTPTFEPVSKTVQEIDFNNPYDPAALNTGPDLDKVQFSIRDLFDFMKFILGRIGVS